jgi:hypothetical protein
MIRRELTGRGTVTFHLECGMAKAEALLELLGNFAQQHLSALNRLSIALYYGRPRPISV